jgi:hypothetical protein
MPGELHEKGAPPTFAKQNYSSESSYIKQETF